MGDVDDIRERLAQISEELADLAMDRLRASIDGDDGDGATQERRITRARRAVDKAVVLLAGGDGGDD